MASIYDAKTASELTSLDPVVPAGDIWIERDTGYAKRGNGATAWTSLGYWKPGALVQERLSGFGPTLAGATGEYWSYPCVHSTQVTVAGTLYTHPVYVPVAVTLDRIGMEVTTGAANATGTMGIYNDDGNGNPGTLLLETAAGIDGNSTTAQEITINKRLAGPGLYHLAVLIAVGTPTVRNISAAGTSWAGRYATLATATGTAGVRAGRSRSGVVGTALPNPAATTAPAFVPLIAVRFA